MQAVELLELPAIEPQRVAEPVVVPADADGAAGRALDERGNGRRRDAGLVAEQEYDAVRVVADLGERRPDEVPQPSPKSALTHVHARQVDPLPHLFGGAAEATTTWSTPAPRVSSAASSSVAPRYEQLLRPAQAAGAAGGQHDGGRRREARSSRNRDRQPGQQNQWSTPFTVACTASGPMVTVIPQTGSTAIAGCASPRGWLPPRVRRRPAPPADARTTPP